MQNVRTLLKELDKLLSPVNTKKKKEIENSLMILQANGNKMLSYIICTKMMLYIIFFY